MSRFAMVYSRALAGMNSPLVEVETHITNGLPAFSIVGLPDTEVKESRDRVRAALLQSGFDFPAQKIIVNLAPAELPKESGRFDLPIAISILAASKQIQTTALSQYEFAGELALSGLLRPVRGALLMARECALAKRKFILPQESANWAAYIDNMHIFSAQSLSEVATHLNQIQILPLASHHHLDTNFTNHLDMADIKGQHMARLALEIAAAGQHSLLMIGPPGTGKSMLANRLPSILPPLSHNEVLDNIALYTLFSDQEHSLSATRPFRSPHHSASAVALVGGGSNPKPGEISLANHGVLFLDELPEFDKKVLETLREPMESGKIHISRALRQVTYPANFQLIAAMNPCPCGYLGHIKYSCQCSTETIKRYQQKISGPLLDRIDLVIEVPSLPAQDLLNEKNAESSQSILKRVVHARELQHHRQGKLNYALSNQDLDHIADIQYSAKKYLSTLLEKLQLSARSFHRILRIARTIADLESQSEVKKEQIIKALSFRRSLNK